MSTDLLAYLFKPAILIAIAVTSLWALPALTRGRVRRGRPVALPASVRPPQGSAIGRGYRAHAADRMARLIIDGDRARVVGSGVHLLTPTWVWRHAPTQRLVDTQTEALGHLAYRRLYDQADRPWWVAVPARWADALQPGRRRLRRWTRWRLAGPRWVGLIIGMLAVPLLAVHLLWWGGHDAQATVVRKVHDLGIERCEIQWTDGFGAQTDIMDCRSGLLEPGDQDPVRALPWPLHQETIGSDWPIALTVLTVIPMLLLSVLGRVVGWWRLRRTPVSLLGIDPPSESGTGAGSPSADEVGPGLPDLTLPGLALHLAEAEGWFEESASAPPNPARERLRGVLGVVLTMGVICVVGGALSGSWGALAVLGIPGVALIAYVAVSLVRSARGDAAARSSSEVSEWPYLAVRLVTDEWVVLLLQGGAAVWLIDLATSRHPDVAGTCQVRGPVAEGRRVVLEIDSVTWTPAGTLEAMTPERRRGMREVFLNRLGVAIER